MLCNKHLNLMIFIFLTCYQVLAKTEGLKKLTVISDFAPIELKMLTNHLAQHAKRYEEITNIIGYCNLINEDLKTSSKENIMFMLKSEVYRGILSNQYLKKENRLQISSTFLSILEQKIKKNKAVYSNFAQWLSDALMSDLANFRQDNFIDKYQSLARTDFKEQQKAKKLKKILTYISPWLEALDKHTPEEFNQLCTKVGIDVLRNIASRTYYFGVFANQYQQQKEKMIFNIPNINLVAPEKVPTSSDEDPREQQKQDAKKLMESLEAKDDDEIENISNQISNEIEKIKPKKAADPNSTWVPK
jgi:hypothetical protein